MNRKALKISGGFLALFGIVMSSVPFIQSMWPNAKQIGKLPHVDVSELKNGHFIEASGTWFKAFILKDQKGEIKVFSIPFWENKYRMPDESWNRAYLPCDKFGPEANQNRLLENGKFKCFDKLNEEWEWWKTDMLWTFEGKSLYEYAEDLMIPRYEIKENTIIIGKSKG